MEETITIRELQADDLEQVVEFSVRAWQPVFESMRHVMGDDVFLGLYPDWKSGQEEAVRSSCTNPEHDGLVAVVGGLPVGFVTIAFDVSWHMGVIDMLAVDPAHQRHGVGSRLTGVALEHMRDRGMAMAMVETGGDLGHAPARSVYERAGFGLMPISRYFQALKGKA